jgi:hypothetical protein
MVWEFGMNLYCIGQGVVTGCREHGDEYVVSHKVGNILTT